MTKGNTDHKTILLCTLGASWAVIPEVLGWLAPSVVDLYAHHPQRPALDALRQRHGLRCPDELWIVTTQGERTQESLQQLHQWWFMLRFPMPLRIWAAAGTNQLDNQAECDHIHELILRVALLASEQIGPQGQLLLSLAGGRKTMSADLQTAGHLFGAAACLHVVGPEPLPEELKGFKPEHKLALPLLLTQALPAHLAGTVMPLVASTGQRQELLDIPLEGHIVTAARFAVPLPAPHQTCAWPEPAAAGRLYNEIERRQRASSQLLGNFLAQLAQEERHENWRMLYRLPAARIRALRDTRVSASHRAWLMALPKADLHRHVGGCLSLPQQQAVAQAIWDEMDDENRTHRLNQLREQLTNSEWSWNWPEGLKGPHRAELSAALLLHAHPTQLQRHLWDVTEPRVALKTQHPHGFAAYERPGELSGSALLTHPAALRPYARALVQQAHAEGLAYVELRGSPHKYRPDDPAAWLTEFRAALQEAGAVTQDEDVGAPLLAAPRIGFIWILDRRQRATLPAVVRQAVAAVATQAGFLLGLDLAGDEGTHNPADLAPSFLPVFEACLPVTIHAGEGESAEHIWQASYHLHADRIGHGLTLAQHRELMHRFRDRGICLELCPTSNREVVGFADPDVPASRGLAPYPLREFLDAGLPVTLCSDNPGISRTTLADEFLTAARMTPDGLTLWDVLALMRQSFVHAFLPAAQRERLLKAVDEAVFKQVAADA